MKEDYYASRAIDPETGLAELPAGWFWRITGRKDHKGKDMYDLKIIANVEEKKTALNWKLQKVTKVKTKELVMHEGYVWYGDNKSGFAHVLNPSNLRYSTKYELDNYYKERAKREEAEIHKGTSEVYLGDYPPKSIN